MDPEEARAFFSGGRFATENGITPDERDGEHAVASLVLSERHRNAHGGVMGGRRLHARGLARGMGGDLIYRPRQGGGAEFVLTHASHRRSLAALMRRAA